MKELIECGQGFLISIRIFNTKNVYEMKKRGDMKISPFST